MQRFPAVSTLFILRQLAALLDRGHDVTVYARERLDHDVEHEEVALYGLLERTRYVAELPRLDSIEWDGAAALFGSDGHDVVNVQMGPVARSFLFAREAFAAPLVVTFHGHDFSAYPRLAAPTAIGRSSRSPTQSPTTASTPAAGCSGSAARRTSWRSM